MIMTTKCLSCLHVLSVPHRDPPQETPHTSYTAKRCGMPLSSACRLGDYSDLDSRAVEATHSASKPMHRPASCSTSLQTEPSHSRPTTSTTVVSDTGHSMADPSCGRLTFNTGHSSWWARLRDRTTPACPGDRRVPTRSCQPDRRDVGGKADIRSIRCGNARPTHGDRAALCRCESQLSAHWERAFFNDCACDLGGRHASDRLAT
jgi:hypothetical protein